MPSFCAASSKLAFSTVIKSVFRAEVALERRFPGSLYHQNNSFPRHQLQTKRHFSHIPTLRFPESHFQPSQPELSSASNASSAQRPRSDRPKSPKTSLDKPPITKKKKPEGWQIQKGALKKKFKEGWNPTKKLSPDAIEGIRQLHGASPDKFTTPVLAEQFKVSPEAIRRILKSKWRASEPEMEDRRKRWQKRHDRIWSQMAELGLRPKTKRTNPLSDSNILYDKDRTE
ncbi:hypothetical protein ASPWEDRAFT_44463 [Aspergillus wentii DTO 134E9]|uniref:Required for respiratory growth protein 9, mitochondrial n=1 Tax=Aspergillus wentii DTO 134E9 TaxID=1073089 RepID=A0A1L9RBS1_ASPWE|nr:uncharacterized protein ASPWEDRAFT_44463 [Aspergillus wentii DTO 134E9]KAI9934929.1 Required for respiratory growth protein 9 mitochondrial [Aspergillus wentii]OJJ32369.1 hypothetical protein ASPWEDRAFT_44463 [Aspergillus wentii DTO 134E9]